MHTITTNCFKFSGNADGTISAERKNPAVPITLVSEILSWKEQGASMEDIVDRLRPRTVPPGYPYTTWKHRWFFRMLDGCIVEIM